MSPPRVTPPDNEAPALLDMVAAAAADDAGLADATLLGGYLEHVVAAARHRRRLRGSDLAECEHQGRRAAELGVASRAAVDLYLSAVWRLWRDRAPGGAEATHSDALFFLRAADDGVAALMTGYQHARSDQVRLQETRRREVIDALIAGGQRAIDHTEPAFDLGLDLSGPTVVAVVGASTRIDDAAGAAIPSRVERALAGKRSDAHPLVTFQDGRLLVLASAPDDAAQRQITDSVSAAVAAAIGPPGTPPRWRIALSAVRTGAAGIYRSAREAMETIDLAQRTSLPDVLVDPSAVAGYRFLLRDRAAALDLVETVLDPLRGARGGAGPYLDTLAAYFSTGGNATQTATRLHLSVRAVTYRLTRVADLLGRDPHDPAERLTLHAAVTAARLIGWPDFAETRQP